MSNIKQKGFTHRPLSSSIWGLPYRILKIQATQKELLRGLWVEGLKGTQKFPKDVTLPPSMLSLPIRTALDGPTKADQAQHATWVVF